MRGRLPKGVPPGGICSILGPDGVPRGARLHNQPGAPFRMWDICPNWDVALLSYRRVRMWQKVWHFFCHIGAIGKRTAKTPGNRAVRPQVLNWGVRSRRFKSGRPDQLQTL